jgi:hypothetical protein
MDRGDFTRPALTGTPPKRGFFGGDQVIMIKAYHRSIR